MAEGDITWHRYIPHWGQEGEVPAGTVIASPHSTLQEYDPVTDQKFVLVRMEMVGTPTETPSGQTAILVRAPSWGATVPCVVIGFEDVAAESELCSCGFRRKGRGA